MITGAINLGIWTLLIFCLGMYKPKWPLFFMKNPSRFLIVVITTLLVMVTFTLYGEGLKKEKRELLAKQPVTESTASMQAPVPVPVPVPVPTPEKIKAK
jgi:hypothetical protein